MLNHKYRHRLDNQFNAACGNKPAVLPKVEYLGRLSNGMQAILTDHAKEAARKRHSMSATDVQTWVESVEHVIAGIKIDHYNQEVFVYSKKHQRGCILAFRRDFKARDRGLAVAIITVYPYGKDIPMQADTPIYRG